VTRRPRICPLAPRCLLMGCRRHRISSRRIPPPKPLRTARSPATSSPGCRRPPRRRLLNSSELPCTSLPSGAPSIIRAGPASPPQACLRQHRPRKAPSRRPQATRTTRAPGPTGQVCPLPMLCPRHPALDRETPFHPAAPPVAPPGSPARIWSFRQPALIPSAVRCSTCTQPSPLTPVHLLTS
jgi:hypothetical protein